MKISISMKCSSFINSEASSLNELLSLASSGTAVINMIEIGEFRLSL